MGHLCLGQRLAIRQCCGDNGALSQGAGDSSSLCSGCRPLSGGRSQRRRRGILTGRWHLHSQLACPPVRDIGPHCSRQRWWRRWCTGGPSARGGWQGQTKGLGRRAGRRRVGVLMVVEKYRGEAGCPPSPSAPIQPPTPTLDTHAVSNSSLSRCHAP